MSDHSSGGLPAKPQGGIAVKFQLLPYLLFLAGIAGIVAFVYYGGLPLIRGLLSAVAWLMIFVLASLSARSAETRRMMKIDEKERLESVYRIRSAVARVNEKARSLSDSYGGEKRALTDMSASVSALLPSPDLEASKMEYEILTGLTRLDFLCDKARSGSDKDGEFRKELGNLTNKLRARERL